MNHHPRAPKSGVISAIFDNTKTYLRPSELHDAGEAALPESRQKKDAARKKFHTASLFFESIKQSFLELYSAFTETLSIYQPARPGT